VDNSQKGLNPRRNDPRIQALVNLLYGEPAVPLEPAKGKDGVRKVNTSAHTALYYPLADAFRATPDSIVKVMAGAVTAFKDAAMEEIDGA
jgi:hypothetical protein